MEMYSRFTWFTLHARHAIGWEVGLEIGNTAYWPLLESFMLRHKYHISCPFMLLPVTLLPKWMKVLRCLLGIRNTLTSILITHRFYIFYAGLFRRRWCAKHHVFIFVSPTFQRPTNTTKRPLPSPHPSYNGHHKTCSDPSPVTQTFLIFTSPMHHPTSCLIFAPPSHPSPDKFSYSRRQATHHPQKFSW